MNKMTKMGFALMVFAAIASIFSCKKNDDPKPPIGPEVYHLRSVSVEIPGEGSAMYQFKYDGDRLTEMIEGDDHYALRYSTGKIEKYKVESDEKILSARHTVDANGYFSKSEEYSDGKVSGAYEYVYKDGHLAQVNAHSASDGDFSIDVSWEDGNPFLSFRNIPMDMAYSTMPIRTRCDLPILLGMEPSTADLDYFILSRGIEPKNLLTRFMILDEEKTMPLLYEYQWNEGTLTLTAKITPQPAPGMDPGEVEGPRTMKLVYDRYRR